jgi:hypothetical protein
LDNVVTFHLVSLSILLSLPIPIAARIQTAFLQDSPALLRQLLTAEGAIPVSLPEPLSLADQLSPDQTYLVFDRIFSVFKTTEFTTDPELSTLPGSPGMILKARWSFRNKRTGVQYPLRRLYFFIVPVVPPPTASGAGPVLDFKIVEIRAEKL